MFVCKHCKKVTLSKMELKIFLFLPATTTFIAERMKSKRTIIYSLLYRMEKAGVVIKIGREGKSIVYNKKYTCKNCVHFNYLSAFNTFDCSIQRSRTEGFNFYCVEHKEINNG